MNERIRLLAEQAGLGSRWTTTEQFEQFMEKFAELIVQECVNVLDPDGEYTAKYKHSHTPGPDGLRTVLSHEHFHDMMAARKIKEHFGVE